MRPFFLTAAAALLALAACDAPTSSGGEGFRQYTIFLEDASIAEFVADTCPSLSLRSSPDAMADGFVSAMAQAGYGPSEIASFNASTNTDAVAARVAQRMNDGGVVFGSAQTFCTFGRAEIENGTRVGSFLR